MEIVFDNVGYTHNEGTSLKKEIIDDIDMVIEEGRITSIIGKSGCGKTTLLEMINGLTVPTKGTVKVGSYRISKRAKIIDINKLRVNVGLVFETPEIQFFSSTVKDELLFGMKSFNYQLDKKDERIKSALQMVGLDEKYLMRDPYTLSNGEKRKVAIASVLTYNPKIIVLDEPTVGLDEISKKNLIKLIKILKNKYKKTIVIASQDIDWLYGFVDYVYVIGNKKVILSGDKYYVFSNVNLLNDNGIDVPKLTQFSNLVLEKKQVKLGYRDEINDLIKDVYRSAK